jgi:hypothetical protein
MAGKEKMTARAVAAAKPGRYCDGRGRVMAGCLTFWRSQVGLQVHLLRPGHGNGAGRTRNHSRRSPRRSAKPACFVASSRADSVCGLGRRRDVNAGPAHGEAVPFLCDAVFQHWLPAADLLQRQLAAFVIKLLEAVEAVAAC